MDSAFFLRLTGPAAGARIVARTALDRAGYAANRMIALGYQGMGRQLKVIHIGLEIARSETRQRLDLEAAIGFLERRDIDAPATVITLAAGNPGVVTRKCLLQRLRLPDVAAHVRVCPVEVAFWVEQADIVLI